MTRRRVLVVTGEPLGETIAGPAIRAWEIASDLAREHEVELGTLARCTSDSRAFGCSAVDAARLRELETWCDLMVVQGDVLPAHRFLARSAKPIVVDLYDPFHLEQLEQAKILGPLRRREVVRNAVAALNLQLVRGDFFLCASERQRALWLGHLGALGRVNPRTYDADATLRRLIDVVPFGIPAEPPRRTGSRLRGVVQGIGADDEVLLWGGGIYDWLDPLTLLRAMMPVLEARRRARLVFLGAGHPNPRLPPASMVVAARSLADELRLTGSSVFFLDGWVPYAERADYLLDADLGVSTHLDSLETTFSFRTRVLDYLWAGLPVVTSGGDALADLVAAERLGRVVPPGAVRPLADALIALLADASLAADCRQRVAGIRSRFRWEEVLAPLHAFVDAPHRAPDLLDPLARADISRLSAPSAGPARWAGAVRSAYAEGGVRTVVDRALSKIQRAVVVQPRRGP